MKRPQIYLAVTADKYELPIAVADSAAELAKCSAVEENTADEVEHKKYRSGKIGSRSRRKNGKYRYLKVRI